MNVLDFFVLLILFGFLAGGMYFLWFNLPTESVEFDEYRANVSADLPIRSSQFYSNMRYPDSSISYSISKSCTAKRRNDFKRAVSLLEDKTILDFYEAEGEGMISVSCSNIAPDPDEEGHFIAGEGGPSYVINTSGYSIITEGRIALYRPESCEAPKVAVHEILHALGFDHNANESSIMYPVTNCQQEIDREIIDEIKRLYIQPSAADLVIESVYANKSGRYLNFEVTISNNGLKDIGDFKLDLISEGEVAESFDVKELTMGAKRHLSVSNLKISRKAKEILFLVRTSEPEITKENNEARIGLVQSS